MPSSTSTPGDKLSAGALAAYGAGIIAYQFPNLGLGQLVMPLYTADLGVSPAVVGTILMIGRIWDAVTNPFMGAWSDNTRTRWGRRRPYLLIGAILCGIAYPLVWLAPRGASPDVLAVYLLVGSLLLYTCFALYSVPYMALAYELTPDYHERTRIQVWRTYFNLVPVLASGWFYWFCKLDWFSAPLTGARWLGLMVGVAIVATGLCPGLFLRERYYALAARQPREPLLASIRAVARNRPFVLLTGVILTLVLGYTTTETFSFYVLAYHVYGGDTQAAGRLIGWTITIVTLSSFAVIPLIRMLELRWGKTRALRFCLWVNIAAAAGKWWLATPSNPWLWVVVALFAQFASLGFWIFVNSMKADVCDFDELASGRRREGAYGAVGNLLQKTAGSLTFLIAGLVLHLAGYDAGRGAAQDPATVLWLRVAFSGGPIFFLTICIILLDRYPLDGPRMKGIRGELEARRDAV